MSDKTSAATGGAIGAVAGSHVIGVAISGIVPMAALGAYIGYRESQRRKARAKSLQATRRRQAARQRQKARRRQAAANAVKEG